jgi:hypothetical protein
LMQPPWLGQRAHGDWVPHVASASPDGDSSLINRRSPCECEGQFMAQMEWTPPSLRG